MATVAVQEKPILFSGAMVRAILAGRKTQTRRVRNLDDINANPDAWHFCGLNGLGNAVFTQDEKTYTEVKNPYGDKGDRLWVRETWWFADYYSHGTYPSGDPIERKGMPTYSKTPVHYAADGNPKNFSNKTYGPKGLQNGYFAAPDPYAVWIKAPSIHMPRWASRINLEITQVRVERVQDISEADAIAEGCHRNTYTAEDVANLQISDANPAIKELGRILGPGVVPAKVNYQQLWDKINLKRGFGWDKNPWVWAISFKLIEEK